LGWIAQQRKDITKMAKGQVQTATNNGGVNAAPAVFQRMLDRMELAADTPDDSFPNPMISGIVGILEANTDEEMWESDELAQIGGRNLRDVEQRIIAYTVRYGDNAEMISPFQASNGRKMYLLIRSMRYDTGEEFVWNTSAPLLVSKILWLADRAKLPADVVIRGTHLGGDQWVLKLKPMPQRVTSEPPF
jgi:hypothetical protein